MSSEYIFEINDALYDHETGRVCMMPKFVGALIRCKDCKHYDIEIPSRCIKDRCYCATVDSFMKPMDYCSYAERKNDED